ncbi:hypothetical protein, partial [Duodenibacillus massiliensis]|uniref:hypothetical protein n=1 Tax=Duodenibacillus massiliensis TaxID=1852381 RepID=UPI003AEFAB3F
TDCFGGRASSTRFCTNGYRMILGMVTLLVLKLARHYLFGVVKESAKKNCTRFHCPAQGQCHPGDF